MYLKPLALWGSVTTSPDVPLNCNVFASFPSSLELLGGATPISFLNYTNECPYPVTVEVANYEDVLDAGFYTFATFRIYVAPFSPMRQQVACANIGNSVTAQFVASTAETTSIDLTCVDKWISTFQQLTFDVPLVGSQGGEIELYRQNDSLTSEDITTVYFPYPVSEVYNGGYTTSTCTTTTTTPEHKHLSTSPLWNYLQDYKSAIGLPKTSKHYQTSSACGFEDIRSDPDYFSRIDEMNQIGRVSVFGKFPYLNTQYGYAAWAYPNGQFYPLREVYEFSSGTTPQIPTSEVYDVIATLWQDYQGLGDFGTLTRGDDRIIQWTDLKISDDAVVSTQLTLHPNGDFKIRTGRCQGDDFGLLDGAVTGYQATDGSGQQLHKTYTSPDPCDIALDFELNYRMQYVEQHVSDWFVMGAVEPFQGAAADALLTLSAIEYGTLVPPPQGEALYFAFGEIDQGTRIVGRLTS